MNSQNPNKNVNTAPAVLAASDHGNEPSRSAAIAQKYSLELSEILKTIDFRKIGAFVDKIRGTIMRGHTIHILGNGGSACIASHIACDIVGACSRANFPAAKVRCLTDSTSIVTALANDFGYEDIFSRQISMFGEQGDLLIFFSVSGRSPNLLRSIEEAQKLDLFVAGVVGKSNEELERNCDVIVDLQNSDYGLVEDVSSTIAHVIARSINNGAPWLCVHEEGYDV